MPFYFHKGHGRGGWLGTDKVGLDITQHFWTIKGDHKNIFGQTVLRNIEIAFFTRWSITFCCLLCLLFFFSWLLKKRRKKQTTKSRYLKENYWFLLTPTFVELNFVHLHPILPPRIFIYSFKILACQIEDLSIFPKTPCLHEGLWKSPWGQISGYIGLRMVSRGGGTKLFWPLLMPLWPPCIKV